MRLPRRCPAMAIILVASSVIALPACNDDNAFAPGGVEEADLVGSFEATRFNTTIEGATTDQLARDAELTIALAADGTTTGRLFIPEGDEDGSDLDASLAGTWSLAPASHQVTFDQPVADTFVRDMTFLAGRAGGAVELRGEETFGETTIEVFLRKQ